MKGLYFLLVGFAISFSVKAQDYLQYTDTVNKFSIYIPKAWKYGLLPGSPSIKLSARRVASGALDTSKLSFNLNVLESPNSSTKNAYDTLKKYISPTKSFKLLREGEVEIDHKKFKWLMESHANGKNGILMRDWVLVTYYKGKVYILTMVGFDWGFDKSGQMYDVIGGSLRLL